MPWQCGFRGRNIAEGDGIRANECETSANREGRLIVLQTNSQFVEVHNTFWHRMCLQILVFPSSADAGRYRE